MVHYNIIFLILLGTPPCLESEEPRGSPHFDNRRFNLLFVFNKHKQCGVRLLFLCMWEKKQKVIGKNKLLGVSCSGFKLGFFSVRPGLFPFTVARMGVRGLRWMRRHVAWFLPPDWSKARVWEDGGKTSLKGLVLKIRTKLQSESIRASV